MHKSETDNSWLGPVLRRGLGRVRAPRELWNRVTLPSVQEVRAEPRRTFMWMIAGVSVVTASVLAVAWGYHPSARVDFRSRQVSEVRDWIRNRTGIVIPFTASDPRVEMIGASVAYAGAVEVRYLVGGREAHEIDAAATGRRAYRLHVSWRCLPSPCHGGHITGVALCARRDGEPSLRASRAARTS